MFYVRHIAAVIILFGIMELLGHGLWSIFDKAGFLAGVIATSLVCAISYAYAAHADRKEAQAARRPRQEDQPHR